MLCLFHFCKVDTDSVFQQGIQFGTARPKSASVTGGTVFRLGRMKSVQNALPLSWLVTGARGERRKHQAISE